MNPRALLQRQPFVGLALAAMLGIAAADHWVLPFPWAFAFAPVALLAVLLWPRQLTCWLFCAAVFFELHAVRHWGGNARWLAGVLASGPRVVHATGIVWNEPEKPRSAARTVTCRFLLKLESVSIAEQPMTPDALIEVSWVGPVPAYGDRVTFIGGASNLPPARNPGQFDFTGYQHRLGIFSDIETRFAIDCHIDSHHRGNPFQAFGFAARHWMQKRLETDLADSPETMAVIDGVVLGLRGETPEDLKTLLQRTGTIHLFVVSGLNIAMLTAIAFYLLKPLGLPRVVVIVTVIVVLLAYTLVTGLRTSSVRSTIMATSLLIASLADRRAVSYNSLAFAALVILACHTNELFTPGFQFSFSLVFIIIATAGRIQRWLDSLAAPDPFLPRVLWSLPVKGGVWCWHHLSVLLGVVIASWVGSLFFTMGYFHLFSPGALVANFFAVAVAFVILSLGLATVLTGALSTHAVVLFNNANWFAAKAMLFVLHTSAALPAGSLYVEVPRLTPPPLCSVTVFDLADGGSAHVRAAGVDWLFDCGDEARYEHVVLPYLRTRGINWLDGLLLTHGKVQHIGGALPAILDFHPRLLADSTLHDRSSTRRNLHIQLAQHRIGKGLYMRGDFLHLGPAVTARVLYPPAGLKRSSADDMALVLQLQAGHTRALFMSDSGFSTEQWLLENEPDLKSDIVIKGQHAKDLSGTPEFLARVAPRVVICTALGYGEPVEKLDEWEGETAAQGITVFRQDKAGAVQIEIQDNSFTVNSFITAQRFTTQP